MNHKLRNEILGRLKEFLPYEEDLEIVADGIMIIFEMYKKIELEGQIIDIVKDEIRKFIIIDIDAPNNDARKALESGILKQIQPLIKLKKLEGEE